MNKFWVSASLPVKWKSELDQVWQVIFTWNTNCLKLAVLSVLLEIVRWILRFMGKKISWMWISLMGREKEKRGIMFAIIPELDDFKSPLSLRSNENIANQKETKG